MVAHWRPIANRQLPEHEAVLKGHKQLRRRHLRDIIAEHPSKAQVLGLSAFVHKLHGILYLQFLDLRSKNNHTNQCQKKNY